MSTWLSHRPEQLQLFSSTSTCERMRDTWQDMAPGCPDDTWRDYSVPFGDNSTCSQGWTDLVSMPCQPKTAPRQQLDPPRHFPSSTRQSNSLILPRPPSFTQPKQWPVFPALLPSRVDNSSDFLCSLAADDAVVATRRQLSKTPPLPPSLPPPLPLLSTLPVSSSEESHHPRLNPRNPPRNPLSALPHAAVSPRGPRLSSSGGSSSSNGSGGDSGASDGGEGSGLRGREEYDVEEEEEDSSAHRRAALDFVLELAGPQMASPSDDRRFRWCPDSLIPADELPVAAFAVDRDLTFVMWNRRMAKLTGWSRDDVAQMGKFPGRLLRPAKGSAHEHASDVLRDAMLRPEPISQTMLLATRTPRDAECNAEYDAECDAQQQVLPGQEQALLRKVLPDEAATGQGISEHSSPERELRVQVHVCMRTDAVGAANGVLCVVMPLHTPPPIPTLMPTTMPMPSYVPMGPVLVAPAAAVVPPRPSASAAAAAVAAAAVAAATAVAAKATVAPDVAPHAAAAGPTRADGKQRVASSAAKQRIDGEGGGEGGEREAGVSRQNEEITREGHSNIFSRCSGSSSGGLDGRGAVGREERVGEKRRGSRRSSREEGKNPYCHSPVSPRCHSPVCLSPFSHSRPCDLITSPGSDGGYGVKRVEREWAMQEEAEREGNRERTRVRVRVSVCEMEMRDGMASPASSPVPAPPAASPESSESPGEIPEGVRGPPELHTPREILPSREVLESSGVGTTRRFLPSGASHTISTHAVSTHSGSSHAVSSHTVTRNPCAPLSSPARAPVKTPAASSSIPLAPESSSLAHSPERAPPAPAAVNPTSVRNVPVHPVSIPPVPCEMKPLALDMKRSPRLQFDESEYEKRQFQELEAERFHLLRTSPCFGSQSPLSSVPLFTSTAPGSPPAAAAPAAVAVAAAVAASAPAPASAEHAPASPAAAAAAAIQPATVSQCGAVKHGAAGLPAIRVQRRRAADVLRPAGHEGGRCSSRGGNRSLGSESSAQREEGRAEGKGAGNPLFEGTNPLLAPVQLLSPLAHSPYPLLSPKWEPDAVLLHSCAALPPSANSGLPLTACGDDERATGAATTAPATATAKGLEGTETATVGAAAEGAEGAPAGIAPMAAAAAAAAAAGGTGTARGMLAGGKRVQACSMLAADRVATGTTAFFSADVPSSAVIPSSAVFPAITSSSYAPSFDTPSLPPSTSLCVRALVADGATGGGAGLGLVGALHNDLPQQLERCGFDVVTAATVTEAVEQFKQSVRELSPSGRVQQGNGFEESNGSAGSKQQGDTGKKRVDVGVQWPLEASRDESSVTSQRPALGDDQGQGVAPPIDRAMAADEEAREVGGTPEAPFSLVVMELE
ncbi:unnamed protein product, partial [Closterium sp. NIES-54]